MVLQEGNSAYYLFRLKWLQKNVKTNLNIN